MSFYLSGGVEVLGFISPTEPTDEYPVIDPLYGIDGFRNVNTSSDLNSIPNLRRRAGMVVGVSGGTEYYKLNPSPWNGSITDWSIFNSGSSGGGTFTGGTVTGDTIFTQGVTATTFSAATYLGLPLDVYVTGGTYSNGAITFLNNSGGTFDVTGLYTGGTDVYVTGGTFNKNTKTLTLTRNDGNDIQVTGFTDTYTTGFTFNQSSYDISIKLNDGTVLTQNLSILSSDVTITGGTYNQLNGVATFTNNTGGTFDVSGFITGFTDVQVTGYTYQDNTFTISDSSGNTFSTTIDIVTGLTINGDLTVTGNTYLEELSATTIIANTYYGDGSNLTGISRGGGSGQLYYFNISNTQTPYYEFSTTATTVTEQTISASTGANSTVYIGGFMTPSNVPGITNIPPGIITFYLHPYGDSTNYTFDIYCEFYTRTTGGTETLLFTSDSTAVVGNTPTMVISDGFFSGATINSSDRLVVKLYGSNITNQTRTIYFVSEGSSHYSFSITTIPSFTDTYVTGFTYNDNTFTISQTIGSPLTATIDTVTGLTVNGNLIATSISATTYENLPLDVYVTGGTYTNGTITFTNNSGNTFNVTGLYTGETSYVNSLTTGTGLSANTTTGNITLINTAPDQTVTISGGTGIIAGGTYPSFTITNTAPDKTVDLNNGSNISVTGTYPNFTVGVTGLTDNNTYVTGFTYNSNNTFTIVQNSGTSLTATINIVSGLTVNGNLTVTGNTNVKAVTGTTALFSGTGQSILTIVGSGNTTSSPLFTVQGSSGELFSVTDSLVGSLYSVNDISGLPILEVFSDNTILMGSYLAPSLNTTTRVIATTGTTNVYSIPTSAYTGAFFDYTVSDGTNLRAGNIMSIWSGSSVNITETQTTDFGNTSGLTFNMVVSSGNAILRTSGTTGNWTVKTIVRSI